MKYEPKKYWNGRGKSFLKGLYFLRSSERFKTYFIYNPFLKHLLRKEIKRIKPRTLLEVGCGPGRLFNLYKGIPEVCCVDFSPTMLKRAGDLIKKRGYENIKLHQMEAQNLGFTEDQFDIVITSNVLLHIPPESIEDAISEIVRVSNGYIVSVEYFTDKGNPSAEQDNQKDREEEIKYCFLHNYQDLFRNKKAQMVKAVDIPFFEQKMFLFQK